MSCYDGTINYTPLTALSCAWASCSFLAPCANLVASLRSQAQSGWSGWELLVDISKVLINISSVFNPTMDHMSTAHALSALLTWLSLQLRRRPNINRESLFWVKNWNQEAGYQTTQNWPISAGTCQDRLSPSGDPTAEDVIFFFFTQTTYTHEHARLHKRAHTHTHPCTPHPPMHPHPTPSHNTHGRTHN